ncbi:MAG: TadE/TadG family type IV pilus assembly protein [Acidobacteriaceae bacterium]|nr:TadE/TadG family type IV pilus assembly protein [Acidobacteriaceae bacterium]
MTMLSRQILLRDSQASTLIETALTLPLLVLLLVMAVDLGNAFSAAIATSTAAQAGALYGIQHPTDITGMVAAARLEAPGLATLAPVATYGCECSDGSSATSGCSSVPSCTYNSMYYVELDTTSTYTPLLPYPGVTSVFTLHGKARMRAAR